MRHTLASSIAAACLALGAFQVQAAEDVKLTGFVYDSFRAPVTTVNFTVNNPNPHGTDARGVSVEAGEMEGTLNGKSFTTFCLDVFQTITFGQNYTNYQLVDLTKTQATSMGELFTKYYDQVDDSKSSAAFQVALWEIMYDSDSSYDLKTGNFKGTDFGFLFGSFGGLFPSVETTAQSWLNNLGTADDYDVTLLQSSTNQDLLTFSKDAVAPVPEPETYALMLAGLGAMGWTMRRRRA
jgi:PEP-CTERM motif